LVIIARILYNVGGAPQAFMLYAIADKARSSNPARDTTILAVVAQVCAVS
jgi:hypothetical protein